MTFHDYTQRLAQLYQRCEATWLESVPATLTQLTLAEQTLGLAIDPALRCAWQHANGGKHWQPYFVRPGYLTGYDFLSVEAALDMRTKMQQQAKHYCTYVAPTRRDPRIAAGWYQPQWLPFASFGSGECLLILDHSNRQVIGFNHDPDEIIWVAESFSALLKHSWQALSNDPDEFIEPDE